MTSEILIAKIISLRSQISNAQQDEDASLKELFYNQYKKIEDQTHSVQFLENTMDSIELIRKYEYDSSCYVAYQAMESSLYDLFVRINTYYSHREVELVEPNFHEIKDLIISQISSAKYLIWIAVAWFTDKDIYQSLLAAKDRGVNIRIVMLDDKNNKNEEGTFKLDFYQKIQVRYTKAYASGEESLHHKFCVFDLERYITGSYNWTYNATKNSENVVLIHDSESAKRYADEFIRLFSC